jgi:predicted TPR repeat methyltransferase
MPYLNRAVTVAPDFVPARLNRAAAEISAGELDAAEADARHVLLVDPSDPVAKKQLEAIRGLR